MIKLDIKEIERKNAIIDKAIAELKNKFVGIDEQIDEVMNNVRTWYLYPQLQNRPLTISIFGLTGTGKTQLVREIAKLLNIEKDFVYFNFAEIDEMRSYEIESTIEEELGNETSNRMFVYDEFQYAATLDENKMEKDNKSALKPFWELMDSGILHKRNSIWEMRIVGTILNYMLRINTITPMKIINGVWVNAQECLETFNEYEISQIRRYFNFRFDNSEHQDNAHHINEDIYRQEDEFFIKERDLETIFKMLEKTDSAYCNKDTIEKYRQLSLKTTDELIGLFDTLYKSACKGYDLNFKDSIIFVIANLDEAYTMSFDVNPDMSPDQFHKITKNISIVDIKAALQKRFRNEQIARLGNLHVIYPSFSSETFRKLIDMTLESYAKDVKELTGYDLVFDKSIKNCIYNEAVFPTHGTRPVFSTIHEIIKSKLPNIVRNIVDANNVDNIDYIEYTHKNKKTVILVHHIDGNVTSIEFKEKLRLVNLRESKKDEKQALCAVHESGHFVLYCALNDDIPEKLISKATDSNIGGFLLGDYDETNAIPSYKDVINDIKITLGGYIAEKIVFGDEHLTNGACSDLKRATILAGKAIQEWGFGVHPYVSTYQLNPTDQNLSGRAIRENEYSSEDVKKLYLMAYNEAYALLNTPEWKRMLKESAKYLLANSDMPRKKMREIYNNVPNNVKIKRNKTYYRDKINEIIED